MDADTPGATHFFVTAREKFVDLGIIQDEDEMFQACIEIFEFVASDKDKKMVAEIAVKFAGQGRELSTAKQKFLELQDVCSKIIALKESIKSAVNWKHTLGLVASYFDDMLSAFFDSGCNAKRFTKEVSALMDPVKTLLSSIPSVEILCKLAC